MRSLRFHKIGCVWLVGNERRCVETVVRLETFVGHHGTVDAPSVSAVLQDNQSIRYKSNESGNFEPKKHGLKLSIRSNRYSDIH